MDEYSPFFYATNNKCIDVLHVILDFYDNLEIRIVDPNRSSLLDLACIDAQLETVRFLLNRDPPLGARYAWDSHGGQALLFAAELLAFDGSFGLMKINGTQEMRLRNQIARSEAVISMLLDRGASVQKAIVRRWYTDIEENEEDMPIMATVLVYAILRCGYELISRLIAEGANVHAWQWTWVFDINPEVDVTALHIGCKYWNVEGVKALLDNHGNEMDRAQIILVRDTAGRISLYWVAEGPGWLEEDLYSEEEITSRNSDIFRLLIASNPETVNARGEDGTTPLFSIIRGHVACGSSTYFRIIIQLFCDKGADAGIQDRKGQNVLYVLAQLSAGSEPINPNILDTLVAYGAKVNDPNLEGNISLHIMARNL